LLLGGGRRSDRPELMKNERRESLARPNVIYICQLVASCHLFVRTCVRASALRPKRRSGNVEGRTVRRGDEGCGLGQLSERVVAQKGGQHDDFPLVIHRHGRQVVGLQHLLQLSTLT